MARWGSAEAEPTGGRPPYSIESLGNSDFGTERGLPVDADRLGRVKVLIGR
jgi:hypothetical protein